MRIAANRVGVGRLAVLWLAVQAVGGGVPGLAGGSVAYAADFWWRGDLGNTWTTTTTSGPAIVNTNFDTGFVTGVDRLALPTSADAVIFAASGALNLSTVLGAPFSVQSVKLESVLSSAVSITGVHALTVTASGVSVAGPAALTLGTTLVTTSGNYLFNVSNASGSLLINSGLGGTNTVTKTGPGLAVLSGTASFTQPVTITGGTLRYGSVGAIPSGRDVNIISGTLDIAGLSPTVGSITFGSSVITTAPRVSNSGAFAQLTLNGNIDYIGADGAGEPALVQARLSLPTGQHLLTNSNGQRSNAPYDLVFSSAITGLGGLTLSDPTLTVAMTGAVSGFGGSTVISGGKLVAGAANALSSQSLLNIQSGIVSVAPTVSAAGVVAGNYNQSIGGLSGTVNGLLDIGSATVAFGGATATTFAGRVTGTTGRLVKQGTGTFSFGGALTNAYTGGTAINGGTIRLLSGSALPAGQAITVAQGQLDLNGFGLAVSTLAFGDAAFPDSKLLSSTATGSTVTLTGDIAYNGAATARSAVVSVPLSLDAGQRTVTNPNGSPGVDAYDLVLARRVSGAGGLTLAAPGLDVALAASNTYTGPTLINGGRLVLAATNALPLNSVVTLTAGTLDLAPATTQSGVFTGSYNQSIASFSAAPGTAVNVGSATFSFGDANPAQVAATLTGNLGRINKRGTGTVTFSGTNSVRYTTVSAGTLALGSADALPSFGEAWVTAGALDIAGFSPAVTNIRLGATGITGARRITNSGNPDATVTLFGDILYQGASDSGVVDVNLDLSLGTHFVEHTNFSLAFLPSYEVILNKTISGPGSLRFLGNQSRFALNATSTYAGSTTIDDAYVFTFTHNALPPTTALRIGTGGALVLAPVNPGLGLVPGMVPGNYDQTVGGLESFADSALVFLGSAALTVNTAFATTTNFYAGSIVGTGGRLEKQGPGLLMLAGTNSYTGPTTVSEGTLQLGLNSGASIAEPSLSGDLVNNATVVFRGVTPYTYSGRLTGSGKILSLIVLRLAADAPLPHMAGSVDPAGLVIDLKNNALILSAQSEAAVRSLVASWWNNGVRNGGGLASSVAASNPFTTLGVATADAVGLASYLTVPLAPSDVIVRYTYLGDTNLDGRLDGHDLANFIEGFSTGQTGWHWGDFNYDNAITPADYQFLATGLAAGLPPLAHPSDRPVPSGGTVPEPHQAALLLPLIATLPRRRRRTVLHQDTP